MIVINNRKYKNPLINVLFGEYEVNQNGNSRNGESIFISYKFDNISLGLETLYDKRWLKEIKINDKKDISNYISDITYEDENGWISLISGTYNCFVNKIENNIFVFEFNCESEECGEYYNILVNEKVKIDFEK